MTDRMLTILCLASYEKGHDFLQECRRQGARTLLLTSQSLQGIWPKEDYDDVFYMPDVDKKWDRNHAILGVSHLAKTEVLDRIVPLDDFDLETAAALREHLRVPGMGETTTRYFRDKLAMRTRAQEAGVSVPDFVHVLNEARLRDFTEHVPAPWVLKPRLLAGAIGIKKIHNADELRAAREKLGDEQSFYLLERYVPGDIYHVDSIWYERKQLFASACRYGAPPMDVSHGGGVFTTRSLPLDAPDALKMAEMNRRVLEAFGLVRGVSHSEFICGQDGKLYFLETSARVGGAHIADLTEAARGINMWAEWAKIELAGGKAPYNPPPARTDHAGLLVCLSKQEWPDLSVFNDKEVVWRLKKQHHVGLIVRSQDPQRVEALLRDYSERVRRDFLAVAPPKDRPTS